MATSSTLLNLTDEDRSRMQRERDILLYWHYSKAVRQKTLPKSNAENCLAHILTVNPPKNEWVFFQLVQIRDLNSKRTDDE